MTIEEEIARTLAEYLVTDFEHGPFSDTSFARAEVESDGMVSLFASESDAAWPVASFDVPQLAEWIVRSPLLNRVRAEAIRGALEEIQARRIEIYNAQIEANKGYLPVVPSAVIGGYQQAEQIALDRADHFEQNSEVPNV